MTEQGTPEWFAERCGKVTASRIADMMARTQKGWGASRANYAAQLVAERLSGTITETFQNDAMRWGTEKEPEARAAYEWATDCSVELVGFIPHLVLEMAGASPDGRVGHDGLVEIKCPGTAQHLATLLGEPIADKYIKQMQFQMACDNRQWCDFVSYDPRLPERMRLHVQRVHRNGMMIEEIEKAVMVFLAEIDETIAKLTKIYGERKAA